MFIYDSTLAFIRPFVNSSAFLTPCTLHWLRKYFREKVKKTIFTVVELNGFWSRYVKYFCFDKVSAFRGTNDYPKRRQLEKSSHALTLDNVPFMLIDDCIRREASVRVSNFRLLSSM